MPDIRPRQVNWKQFELGGYARPTIVTRGPAKLVQDGLINTEPPVHNGAYRSKQRDAGFSPLQRERMSEQRRTRVAAQRAVAPQPTPAEPVEDWLRRHKIGEYANV